MKKLFILIAAMLCLSNASAQVAQVTMCSALTAAAACSSVLGNTATANKTYQATGSTTSGTGSCVAAVQGSNDGTHWDTIGTITLTLGTTSTSDSFTSSDRYTHARGNVTTLSGTGAVCSVTKGF